MKFLVLSTPRPGAPPLQNPVAMYQAAKAYIDMLLASHKADCVYAIPTGAGVVIANAGSAEEITAMLWAYPMHDQSDWSVQPLADVDVAFDQVIELGKRAPK